MTRREPYTAPSRRAPSTMIEVLEVLFPQTVYPNRIIEPSGNNVIILRNNNTVYVFDIDGTILRTYEENSANSN